MIGWTSNERKVLEDILSGEHSNSALKRFCEFKAKYYRESCASLMELIPARADEARNHAARASTYAGLLQEIEDAISRE